ncbi:unnamed protein product [Effrenium voratum]|nr:unnamed protein product [Effrenium voratum]
MNETKMQEDREREEGGLCCFSGENSKDTCGTCYPMSIASYKTKCSRKSQCLGDCGGTWCASKCVLGAADPFRKCGTAYPEATSSDPVCSKDAEGCKSCKGEWCRAGWNSHFTLTEGKHGAEVPEYVAPEETRGVCCYRGTDKADTCGSCADVAKDATCSTKSKCGGCGGTWCHGPRCVKAFKDKKDPCNTAFPYTGVAAADDFCALNDKHCSSCHGAWCMIGNITFYDGIKYDPDSPYESPTDQRLTPVNQTEIKEAEEEVSSDEGLTAFTQPRPKPLQMHEMFGPSGKTCWSRCKVPGDYAEFEFSTAARHAIMWFLELPALATPEALDHRMHKGYP